MAKRNETVSNAKRSNITDTSAHETSKPLKSKITRLENKLQAQLNQAKKKLKEESQLQQKAEAIQRNYEIEKTCKNEAYYFILSSGNFKKFAEFHKKHRATLDYHGACLAQLYLDSFTTK